MNLVSSDLKAVLKFLQDTTDIKGYTTRRRQESDPPFFYLKSPVGKPTKDSSGFFKYRPLIHGTLFLDKEKQPESVAMLFETNIQKALLLCCFDIPLVDDKYIPCGGRLEDVQFEMKQVDVDVWTFTVKGERFLSLDEEVQPLRKVHNSINVR
ncbi:hypothetical protein OCD90_26040 [Bacillus pacificus]|uniref:hypothetical protein n=1 Tax=Bacillus TaxID=1386 RepID=UPI000945B1D8|nr:hypothetical protein [Bacillus pacificus]MPU16811.1 hypothetical protein [Acinetobacter baumannii]MCC2419300.1 hypothetical protein [Bacillus pacificus]MCU5005763.1 hypothetical protein [Bacillus pacificus]MCU5259205.1 hypothetical protein [Bacillus pacificus]MCU5561979.1 hypothetical protein [Bacillus pacificus]